MNGRGSTNGVRCSLFNVLLTCCISFRCAGLFAKLRDLYLDEILLNEIMHEPVLFVW